MYPPPPLQVELFTREVLDTHIKPEDEGVDYILSTIHAAKGLEWDRVQILDGSLVSLARYTVNTTVSTHSGGVGGRAAPPFHSAAAVLEARRAGYTAAFDCKNHGDDLNLWYVCFRHNRLWYIKTGSRSDQ